MKIIIHNLAPVGGGLVQGRKQILLQGAILDKYLEFPFQAILARKGS